MSSLSLESALKQTFSQAISSEMTPFWQGCVILSSSFFFFHSLQQCRSLYNHSVLTADESDDHAVGGAPRYITKPRQSPSPHFSMRSVEQGEDLGDSLLPHHRIPVGIILVSTSSKDAWAASICHEQQRARTTSTCKARIWNLDVRTRINCAPVCFILFKGCCHGFCDFTEPVHAVVQPHAL